MVNTMVTFETDPSRYKHMNLKIEGGVARLDLNIQEDGGLRPGYELKLNSYDLGVDIELADAVQRMRFEHPEVACVVIGSALEDVFSSGANIFMLGSSSHAWKVNFCKFTNETRNTIEDATEHSGQVYIAALNGVASGGGYELPLACREIYLVDDRRSAVSLPEVPYLGVLPGTGGITRVVDKRKVRKDRADVFITLAEGVKGKRARDWGLVDDIFPKSKFEEKVSERAAEIVAEAGDRSDRKGVVLTALNPEIDDDGIRYRHVTVSFAGVERTATVTMEVPENLPAIPDNPEELGADWWSLRAFRELDDALLLLRANYPEIGLLLLETKGNAEAVLKNDEAMLARKDHWFVQEVLLHMKRVFKRLDLTAKSMFALVQPGSCFAGSLLELALAADRTYMLDDDDGKVQITLNDLNFGPNPLLPMSNGLSRLETRFLGDLKTVESLAGKKGESITGGDAEEIGLVLAAYDDIDWADDVRIAIEERASLSPDALTGMEANIRFAGPETMETKIFGRLTAWQNWIFQRPNAVGEKGALSLYGRPESPEFDWRRT